MFTSCSFSALVRASGLRYSNKASSLSGSKCLTALSVSKYPKAYIDAPTRVDFPRVYLKFDGLHVFRSLDGPALSGACPLCLLRLQVFKDFIVGEPGSLGVDDFHLSLARATLGALHDLVGP